MALEVLRAAAVASANGARTQISHQMLHPIAILLKRRVVRIDVSVEGEHGSARSSRPTTIYHPQQSVLKPQSGHRHTACMRYISAPQRSQSIWSGRGGSAFNGESGRGTGFGSDIAA